jgi:peptidoglycan/LPS O-acetylase OafA/YrhL
LAISDRAQPHPAGSSPARPAKRDDIDGLRAVAVIPVVLFHAGLGFFSGGFVGVDVFFVISGFLITTILLKALDSGRFSLIEFYERRCRRILPALFAMMAAVLVATWVVFLRKDFEDVGQSLVAAPLFSSNLLFYIKTNYFESPAVTKPLLHTWSLAVEEQYYLFFPILLYFIHRYSKHLQYAVIAALGLASFAASVWGVYFHPTGTFYLPMTRIWELLVGSAHAVGVVNQPSRPAGREALGAIGLLMILASIFVLDPDSAFPGPGALPACLGTAFLIYSGAGARLPAANRLLTNRILVFVGLISYSLYLWHWPAFVIAEYRLIRPLTLVEIALLLAGIFAVSVASWYFVELPVRERRRLGSRKRIFLFSAAVSLAFVMAGAAIYYWKGVPSRLPLEVQRLEGFRDAMPSGEGCDRFESVPFNEICTVGRGEPAWALWGDSHAQAVRPVFELFSKRSGEAGIAMSANSCVPLAGARRWAETNNCVDFNRQALELIRSRNVGTVYLAAVWRAYLDRRMFRDSDLASGLASTLRALKGRRVVVVATVPGARYDVPSAAARSTLYGQRIDLELTLDEYRRREEPALRELRKLQREFGFEILFLDRQLCDRGHCRIGAGGQLLYRDDHHLTPAAAPFLEPMIESGWRSRPGASGGR